MNYKQILDLEDNKDIINSLTETQIRGLVNYFLFEEKKFIDDEDVLKNITYNDFLDSNLMPLLNKNNKSPYEVLNRYYRKFNKYESRLFTKGKWDNKNIQLAILNILVENNLFTDDDILNNFSVKFLSDNGFPASYKGRNLSLYDLLDITFPGRFNELQMKRHARGFWAKYDNVLKAINYILEKECIKYENARNDLRTKMFDKYRFKSLLGFYGYSYVKILDFLDKGKETMFNDDSCKVCSR